MIPKNIRTAVAMIVGSVILENGALATPIFVRWEPSMNVVQEGQTFELFLVADIPDSSPVVGWGMDIQIDNPAIVSPVGTPNILAPWHRAPFTPDGDFLAGLAFPDSVSGMGQVLARVTLLADDLNLDSGQTVQTLVHATHSANDPTEGFALEGGGFAEVFSTPAQVIIVPEPAGFVLLLAASAGYWRRRRRS